MQKKILSAYLLINIFYTLAWLFYGTKKSPGLIQERLHPGPGSRESPWSILFLYLLPASFHYIVAALDISKYHWSDTVPIRLRIAGLIGYAISTTLIFWATITNPFFSSVIRIQKERGHRVITTGPYQYVRHPGYAASFPYFLGSGLALGSWWSLVPVVIFLLAIFRRTLVEDRFLQEELEGYKEYAERVHYRLVPGIW